MNELKSITVYCGSNYGTTPHYYHAGVELGRLIAERGSRLVYGGGESGLMGTIADSALAHGGEVIGVIPTFLKEKEKAHSGLTTLIETPDMTVRKAKLIELSDGFIAMAGGLGTYEELYEILSKVQLGLLDYPVGLLNINGYFDPIIAMLAHTADKGFMSKEDMTIFCVADNPAELLEKMSTHKPTKGEKWQKPDWLVQLQSN